MENWKSISSYEGYEVSDLGRVRSLNFKRTGKTKILQPIDNGKGYLFVSLCKDGKVKMMYVHRLVASAFLPNPLNLDTVNHKNEDKRNNNVSNLEWMSQADNNNYGTRVQRAAEANSKVQINHPKKSKQVQMLDKSTGKLLAIFPSIQEAERQIGIAHSSIVACCKGRLKSAGGYVWRYS